MVGLSQTQTRAVGEFSKGMQRRIGLAQALINDPDLVILDEPTSGLDPIGCREVKDLILALARRGKTVILSSHLLADVEDVCDRVVIYYGGKIQAMGTLKELLADAGHAPHHHAGAAARNAGARAGNHPQGRGGRTRCAWTPRRKTWRAISSTWCRRRAQAAAETTGAHVRRPRGGLSARRGGRQAGVGEDSGAAGRCRKPPQPAARPPRRRRSNRQ